MEVWNETLEAVDNAKCGFLIAMVIGYGIYRLLRSNEQKQQPNSPNNGSTQSNNANRNEKEKIPNGDIKMVLIIRTDLNMSKGKIAAQCAHGAVTGYKSARKHPQLLKAWEREGQKKITLKVDSEIALNELHAHARAFDLLCNITHDAGRTQIAAGSATVCTIGPGPSKLIDQVTGHLKLF